MAWHVKHEAHLSSQGKRKATNANPKTTQVLDYQKETLISWGRCSHISHWLVCCCWSWKEWRGREHNAHVKIPIFWNFYLGTYSVLRHSLNILVGSLCHNPIRWLSPGDGTSRAKAQDNHPLSSGCTLVCASKGPPSSLSSPLSPTPTLHPSLKPACILMLLVCVLEYGWIYPCYIHSGALPENLFPISMNDIVPWTLNSVSFSPTQHSMFTIYPCACLYIQHIVFHPILESHGVHTSQGRSSRLREPRQPCLWSHMASVRRFRERCSLAPLTGSTDLSVPCKEKVLGQTSTSLQNSPLTLVPGFWKAHPF